MPLALIGPTLADLSAPFLVTKNPHDDHCGLFSIRAVVVKRFQANNSNFCRSRARASLRDQPLALPAWHQHQETEQPGSLTVHGRAIDTRVQSELVSSIVPRGTSLRWIVVLSRRL